MRGSAKILVYQSIVVVRILDSDAGIGWSMVGHSHLRKIRCPIGYGMIREREAARKVIS